jgi:hypothetical protein
MIVGAFHISWNECALETLLVINENKKAAFCLSLVIKSTVSDASFQLSILTNVEKVSRRRVYTVILRYTIHE